MKTVLKGISVLGLVGTILPPILYFSSVLTKEQMKFVMTVAMLCWFIPAWLWMKRPE